MVSLYSNSFIVDRSYDRLKLTELISMMISGMKHSCDQRIHRVLNLWGLSIIYVIGTSVGPFLSVLKAFKLFSFFPFLVER